MAVAASTQGMPLERLPQVRTHTLVRTWIYTLAALVVLMVAVGGATRLTGSGLSITEWKPVAGAIPPLTERPGRPSSRSTGRFRNTNSSTRA